MSITCRPASQQDITVLNQFQRDIVRTEAPFIPGRKEEDYTYYDIAALIESSLALVAVAECDGKVVGSGYVQQRASRHYYKNPHHGYVGFMYTLPQYRRNGVAKSILGFLGEWARENGMDELRLDVFAANHSAISAYKSAGFESSMVSMRYQLT